MKEPWIVLIALLLILSSCSESPMDTPIQSSSISKYVNSVAGISKGLNEQEKERFLIALEILSGDTYKAATMIKLGGDSTNIQKVVLDAIQQFDGKPPRDIIRLAEERLGYLKDQLKKTGRQVDGKTVQEIKAMAKEENIPMEMSRPSTEPEITPKGRQIDPSKEAQRAQKQAEDKLKNIRK